MLWPVLPATPAVRDGVAAALVGAAAATSCLAAASAQHGSLSGVWWAAHGLGVAGVLLASRRRRAVALLLLGVLSGLADVALGRAAGPTALATLAEVGATALTVALLVRLTGGALRALPDVAALGLAAAAGALPAAVLDAAAYALAAGGSRPGALAEVALSHFLSVLLLAPLVMVDWRGRPARAATAVGHAAGLGALVVLFFAVMVDGLSGMLAMALPIPLVVWAAVRHELRTVLLLLAWLAAVTTACAALFPGRFVEPGQPEATTAQVAQVYLLLCTLVALTLTMAMREREQARCLLEESETTYRRAFTRAGLPAVLCTVSGEAGGWDVRIDLANHEASRVLGRSAAELQDLPLDRVLQAPGLLPALAAAPVRDFAGWRGPLVVVGHHDLHLEGSCSLVSVAGAAPLLSLTMVDLTGRHRLQRRLEAERTWTRAVIDTAASMTVVTDARGLVLAVNPTAERLTGRTAQEMVGRSLAHVLGRAPTEEPLALPPSGELTLTTRSGAARTVQFSHASHRLQDDGPDGATTTLVFSATDVTEARESAVMVDHLLRSVTSIAFLGTDPQGRITMFSTGAERLLGRSAPDAHGLPLVDLLRAVPTDPGDPGDSGDSYDLPDQRRPRLPRFAEVVGRPGAAPAPVDWMVLVAGGDPVRVALTCSPVRGEQGTVHSYLFVARDVTETRRNQEILVNALRREREVVTRLEDLDRAKDDFISTVSHELRTPMSSIIGSAEMLDEGIAGELAPAQRRLVGAITRNGDRLLHLADDLLTLAAFDRGEQVPRGGEVDLRDVVAESLRTVRTPTSDRHLDWRVRLPSQPTVVVGDPSHLERAISNLLVNAVKFTDDGGRVEVVVGSDTRLRSATVTVRDTGCGIAEGDVARVFERFYRSEEVQERAVQGTGLGLAIVESIVRSHEGRVEIDSELGAGTTVVVRLPLVPVRSAAHLV